MPGMVRTSCRMQLDANEECSEHFGQRTGITEDHHVIPGVTDAPEAEFLDQCDEKGRRLGGERQEAADHARVSAFGASAAQPWNEHN